MKKENNIPQISTVVIKWYNTPEKEMRMQITSDFNMSLLDFIKMHVGVFGWMVEEQRDMNMDEEIINSMFDITIEQLRELQKLKMTSPRKLSKDMN